MPTEYLDDLSERNHQAKRVKKHEEWDVDFHAGNRSEVVFDEAMHCVDYEATAFRLYHATKPLVRCVVGFNEDALKVPFGG